MMKISMINTAAPLALAILGLTAVVGAAEMEAGHATMGQQMETGMAPMERQGMTGEGMMQDPATGEQMEDGASMGEEMMATEGMDGGMQGAAHAPGMGPNPLM